MFSVQLSTEFRNRQRVCVHTLCPDKIKMIKRNACASTVWRQAVVFLSMLTMATAATLEFAASVPTAGNAGFEAFRLPSAGGGDDDVYLAAANFWDGASANMSARSTVFKVKASKFFQLQTRTFQEPTSK